LSHLKQANTDKRVPLAPAGGFVNGSIVGDTYRVIDFIGAGGMGLVYKVEHTIMHKVLALKVLRMEYLSESVWQRFRIEAQAIARLNHDNVVKIYDMNQTADGRPFYTMDLIDGDSLADYLQEHQRLPVEVALPLFRQVCAGLAYAHDHGIIHRDIKPGNIMLVADGDLGKVKIVDFGIAKMTDDGRQTMQGLTRPGEVFGSPLYMSPEQCLGEKLDLRSDLYSVGVTFFQALTGKPPFLGRSAMETTTLHLSQEPPALGAVAQELKFDARLEELVATMLAKAPADRYSSLSEVAALLLAIEKGDGHTSATKQISGARPALRRTVSPAFSNVTTELDLEIDKEKVNSASAKGPAVLLLVAAPVLLLTVLALVALNSKWFVPKPLVAQVKAVPRIAPIVTSRMDNDEIFIMGDRLDSALKKEAETFAATRSKPYSSIKKIDGTAMRVFSFPVKFSIGGIVCTVGRVQEKVKAQGKVVCLEPDRIGFEANPTTAAVPELIKFFQPHELNSVMIKNVKPRDALLSTWLARLTSLTTLNVENSAFTNQDLAIFETLPELRELHINHSGISGQALATSKLLPKLEKLAIAGIDNCAPVLVALTRSTNIKMLNVDGCKLTQSDIANIGKLKDLQQLSLKYTGLKDRDLEKLTVLKNLTHINIAGNEITARSQLSLNKFPILQDRLLPTIKKGEADWTSTDIGSLKM